MCKIIQQGFDDAVITIIIDEHNDLRQRVASGLEANGDQPAASDMMKVTWNTELGRIAQRWADQTVPLGTTLTALNVMEPLLDKTSIVDGVQGREPKIT